MRRVAADFYGSSGDEDDSAKSVQESSEGEQPSEPSEEDTSLPGRRRRGTRGLSASRADKRIRTSSKVQPDDDFLNVLGEESPFPSDLVIRVKGGKTFNCHKCILQKRAAHFEDLASNEVSMEDVRAEDMDWAIKSLYRNEVKTRPEAAEAMPLPLPVDSDEAEDEDEGEQSQEVELPSAVRLLVLIKRLGAEDLQTKLERDISLTVGGSNAMSLCLAAKRIQAHKLEVACMKYMRARPHQVATYLQEPIDPNEAILLVTALKKRFK